jgi:hypothetical protein
VQRELRQWFNTVVMTRRAPGAHVMVIKCLAEGTRIPLGDGTWRPIEMVRIISNRNAPRGGCQ